MEGTGAPFAVVFSSNRGVQLMARVALASAGMRAVLVADSDGLTDAIRGATALLVAREDALRAGIAFNSLRRLAGAEMPIVLLGEWPEGGDALSRTLPIPFTTRDVVEAIRCRPTQTQASVIPEDLIREEVERLVSRTAHQVIEAMARRIVPELAEAIIREQLDRLLREETSDKP